MNIKLNYTIEFVQKKMKEEFIIQFIRNRIK